MSSTETPPRRSRRSDGPAKGDLREQALLDACGTLLRSGRFAETSVSELAEAAGISRAAFYFYFASKEALLARVLDAAVRGFNARVAAVLDPDDVADPAVALRASVEAAAELWWEHADVLVASVDLGMRVTEVYERTQANLHVVGSPTSALLQRHGRVPEAADPADADALVHALTLMSERNFYHLMRGDPTPDDLRRTTDRLARIWLRAFGLDRSSAADPSAVAPSRRCAAPLPTP